MLAPRAVLIFVCALLMVLLALNGGMPFTQVQASPDAQESQLIRYGETVSGALSEDVPCLFYRFDGTAGDLVTIDMRRTSGDLDGVLTLFEGAGEVGSAEPLAQNDDRPTGGLDPLITAALPETGPYTIAACRLQAAQMRVTTGTFALTLAVPEASAGLTETPSAPLSGGVFGDAGTPTPTSLPEELSPPSTTPASPLLQMLTGDGALPVLVPGETIDGVLARGATDVRYTLVVGAGDRVALYWRRAGTEGFAPLLRISDEAGAVLAEAAVSTPVDALRLTATAPAPTTLIVTVTRSEAAGSDSGGSYTLTATIAPGDAPAPVPTVVPAPTATPVVVVPPIGPPADYLAAPCQSEASAVSALAQSATLVDVYLAAGDSYYTDELTRTDVFAVDDDLNAVFLLQNVPGTTNVAGIFCAPDGTFFDGGESPFEVGGPHLIGLDWEYYGALWLAGDWYAELYVDDVLALSVRFRVE